MTIQSRRDWLVKGGLGFGSLALGDLLARDTVSQETNPLAPHASQLPGTSKSVIFLFMQGGPSHLETFDPKPLMKKYDDQLLP